MSFLEYMLKNAIRDDNLDAIRLYLAEGANPNEVLSNGKTCLIDVILRGNLKVLDILVTSIVQQNCSKDKPMSSLYEKAKCNHIQGYELNSDVPDTEDASSSNNSTSSNNSASSSDSNATYSVSNHGKKMKETPSPQDDLEWDEELGVCATETIEDEALSYIHKWYASILETTGCVLQAQVSPNVDQQDSKRMTALHYAAQMGDAIAVRMLITAGCKLDIETDKGITPLHLAVMNNHKDVVEILLQNGSRVNQKTYVKMTTMHMAAVAGNLEIMKVLINNGACLEERDMNDRTALYLAARKMCYTLVKYLIMAGANVNAEDVYAYTPLCEAVWNGHSRMVKLLIQSGARITPSHKLLHYSITSKRDDIVGLIAPHTTALNLHDYKGYTPLMLSLDDTRAHLIKYLIKMGANANVCHNVTGESVIHVAVKNIKSIKLFEELLLLFLKENVSIDGMANSGTPLHNAILQNDSNIAAILIKHGADVNASNLSNTLHLDNLTIACNKRNINLSLLLIKAGHRVTNPAFELLQQTCSFPLKLKALCRINIRANSNNNLLYKYVELLSIPQILKSYLMFEHS